MKATKKDVPLLGLLGLDRVNVNLAKLTTLLLATLMAAGGVCLPVWIRYKGSSY